MKCSSTCTKGCEECFDSTSDPMDDCACAEGYEYDDETNTCMEIPEPDPVEGEDGESDDETTGSSSANILKAAIAAIVLCLSLLI